MKIEKIIVKNLFGMFHHEIPLNFDDHITIIHGPNGFGKTILLTMLNALFKSKYHEIRSVPFSEFIIEFDNKSNLLLKKKIIQENLAGEKKSQNNILTFEFKEQDKKPQHYTLKPLSQPEIRFPLGMIESEIAGLSRIGGDAWIFFPTQEKLSLEEVLDRFGDELPVHRHKKNPEPEWLEKIKESINISFIETQRLLSFSFSHHKREYERRPQMVPTVINYSEELKNAIQAKLAEYGSLSQSLDRTFPTRLVTWNSSSEPTMDELNVELNNLEEKRSRLMSTGLLDKEKEKEIDFKILLKIDKSDIKVLSVYIEDVKKKLSVFDELSNKIDLLVNIINSRFLYKQMTINKRDGFIFKTYDDKYLSSTNLSSGEQHELVLFYELLFKVKPNSLILIDEPELSLHVGWQQQFLKDLQEITKLTGFDVLIATHSPQLIHNRWDLTVELKGPKNEEVSESY